MTRLKYGKVYIDEGSIRSALRLTGDSHLEIIEHNEADGTIEFKVVASSENNHEWLIDKPDSGLNIRRVRVPFNIQTDEKPLTQKEVAHAKEVADLLAVLKGIGFDLESSLEFIRNVNR